MEGFVMSEKVKREKTKYPNIYFNTSTGKYDVKYNYKIYDPLTQKNKYKAQWRYNITSLKAAREELAKLQTGIDKSADKDITLQGAFELWKNRAAAQNFSKTTIRNTEQQVKMLCQFIPMDTKIKDMTEDLYYKVFADCRKHGYSEETIHSINATFRKLVQLAYKKGLVSTNFLQKSDNIKTKRKDDIRIITHEEWIKLDKYFHETKFVRLGVDRYPRFRFMFNLLYYTGIRIGECLALTYKDFEEFDYYKKNDEKPIRLAGTKATEHEHLRGIRLNVKHAMLADGSIKETKNSKERTIPLDPRAERLYCIERDRNLDRGGDITDRVFPYAYGNCLTLITKACEKVEIPHCSLHTFRHTFISNMIRENVPISVIEKVSGDTQETIFKRYSHMFERDEVLVLKALENL